MTDPRPAIRTCLEELLSADRPSDQRIVAASKLLTVAEAMHKRLAPTAKILAKAVASHTLERLDPHRREPGGGRYWREFTPPDPEALTPNDAELVATLLYDGNRHLDAEPFFAKRLQEVHDDPKKLILLAAYNLEGSTRDTGDISKADEALRLLNQNRAQFASDPELRAEYHHCRGHLLLARTKVSIRQLESIADDAISELKRAATMDASYTSCYTSAFAEVGDYLQSVVEALHVIKDPPFAKLKPADAVTVAMEVVFYLGYAYACMGEYQRALDCFRTFGHRMRAAGLTEPRDHATLFSIKTELRQMGYPSLNAKRLRGWVDELRGLSFESRASYKVAAQKDIYADVVEYLAQIASARESTELANTDALARAASRIVEDLLQYFGGSFTDPIIAVAALESEGLASLPLVSEGVVRDLGNISGTATEVANDAEVLAYVAGTRSALKALMDHRRLPDFALVQQADGADDAEFPFPCAGNQDEFERMLFLSAAGALIRRFLMDDEYVFGLSPCYQSPAVRYQGITFNVATVMALMDE